MEIDRNILIRSLRIHLEENDGELVYWGEGVKSRHATFSINVACRDLTPSPSRGLEELRTATIGDCQRCPLGESRHQLVFGVGNPEAAVMFIGEGPGFDEDIKGEPFVGKAGQLLDKIMASIGLNRSNVYIANVVKCHPMIDLNRRDQRGNDRPPIPVEIEKCFPFLLEQIKIIKPRVIVTLGGVATKAILRRSEGISSLRGKFYNVTLDGVNVLVLPTFHPAALLRDETLKRSVWQDMKLLRKNL
ncbi:MAG: uracil-DNA glycosylase [Elusimicrobia bacterium]|nr:uracil-DNA glycosylase [Candidatus Obscuribacterium magneticum]